MAAGLEAAGHIASSEKTEVVAVAWFADQDPSPWDGIAQI